MSGTRAKNVGRVSGQYNEHLTSRQAVDKILGVDVTRIKNFQIKSIQ